MFHEYACVFVGKDVMGGTEVIPADSAAEERAAPQVFASMQRMKKAAGAGGGHVEKSLVGTHVRTDIAHRYIAKSGFGFVVRVRRFNAFARFL
jgi:hypothetical protein